MHSFAEKPTWRLPDGVFAHPPSCNFTKQAFERNIRIHGWVDETLWDQSDPTLVLSSLCHAGGWKGIAFELSRDLNEVGATGGT